MDGLDLAVYQTAHNADGGIPSLAKKINVNEGTLYNKVNPNTETHSLNIHEARAMMLATNDYQILDALAKDCARIVFRVQSLVNVSDIELLNLYAKLDKERGDVGKEISDAFSDKEITLKEFVRIEQAAREEISALMELVERLRGLVVVR